MNEIEHPLHGRPWYREPWPWILMSGPFTVVVAGLVTAWIAVANEDPLVVDNYYKEGLAINRVLERDQAAAQGGYRAELMLSQDGARVRAHLTRSRAGAAAAVAGASNPRRAGSVGRAAPAPGGLVRRRDRAGRSTALAGRARGWAGSLAPDRRVAHARERRAGPRAAGVARTPRATAEAQVTCEVPQM